MIKKVMEHLETLRKTDGQLDDGMKNPEKTEDGLNRYIIGQARKELLGRDGAVEKEVVYGWAIHYFTETINEDAIVPNVVKEKTKVAKKTTKDEVGQKVVQLTLDELF